MIQKSHHIAVLWPGTIKYRNTLDTTNIQIFQNIGLDTVQEAISKLDFNQVDVVIGAPGIAGEIRRLIPVPLVIFYPSYIDILGTIKEVELSQNLHDGKIALILHENNKIHVDRLDYYIHNVVDLYTFNSKVRVRQILQNIAHAGYDAVIGGPMVASMASEFKLKATQLIYEEQALLDALEKTREALFLMDKELHNYERVKAIFDVIPDGIIETNTEGTIESCNRKALEILRLSHEQALGHNVCQLLGDPSWESVYRNNTFQVDTIFTYGKTKYFSTRQPILDAGRIIGTVGTLQRVSKIQNMESKFRSLQGRGLVAVHTFDKIITESPLMREIIARAKIYSKCDLTLLLEGETGTGKEIFAQSIHNFSQRNRGPFIAVNCAALTESLLESELLGYDEGAFTGAKKGGKPGLFEQAHQGTIFLDEINNLPIHLQGKLLRVMEERAVRHLGGEAVIPIDVRIIAATNENLKDKIKAHLFRNDLYYRLNVLQILLPPLRERQEDIPFLMEYFATRFEKNKDILAQRVRAMHSLVADYDWPGNIRELQNFVARYMSLSDRIDYLDKHFFLEFQNERLRTLSNNPQIASLNILPQSMTTGDECEKTFAVQLDTLENMETSLIRSVVDYCGGNKSRAALLMNVSRNTIHLRMKG